MEIACLVTVRIPATKKNTEIAELYIELVEERYADPKEEEILGCYVTDIEEEGVIFAIDQGENRERNPPRKTSSESRQPARKKQKQKQLDIRTLFAGATNQRNPRETSSSNKETETDIIEID